MIQITHKAVSVHQSGKIFCVQMIPQPKRIKQGRGRKRFRSPSKIMTGATSKAPDRGIFQKTFVVQKLINIDYHEFIAVRRIVFDPLDVLNNYFARFCERNIIGATGADQFNFKRIAV